VKKLSRFVGVMLERHPMWVLGAAVLITIAAVLGVLNVEMKTGEDTMVSSGSKIYRDTQRYESQFGGDALLVLLTGELDTIFSADNLATLQALEQDLSQSPGVMNVLGPATLLAEMSESLAEDPDRKEPIDVSLLWTEDGNINPRLAPVVPDDQHALIAARLVGGMSIGEQGDLVDALEDTVTKHPLDGVGVLVSGTPKVGPAIEDSMVEDMRLMLVLAVALMVLVLFVVFRARWPLLSLPLALIGVLWAFGVMGFVSLPLSMVTMSGLPILIGLGVDYAIQFHNRYEEEIGRGDTPASAVIDAITHIGPAVGIAVLATALGFVALLVSSMPMIRDFGIQLTIGVVLLYLVGLFLLNAILYQRDKRRDFSLLRQKVSSQGGRVQSLLAGLARNVVHRPLPIVLVAVAASGLGFYLDHQLTVQTDFERLMPQDNPALKDLREVRAVLGGTREVGILVEGDDLARPQVLAWMLDYQERQATVHEEAIVASTSLASLLASGNGGSLPPAERIPEEIAGLAPASRDSVISADGSMARISFTTAPLPVADLNDLVDALEADLSPPAGVSASPAGRFTIIAHSITSLTENRLLITLIALAAIVSGLFLVYRNLIRSAVPVVPILLVVGWSSALMYVLGIELNPLTAVLGSLIIGIGTEFTVLLMERYYEEKAKGEPPAQAMIIAVSRIGRAITASGLTVIGGFSALLFSDFPMLQDFGKVTVIDVSLILVSTLVVLPPVIVWLDERIQRRKMVRM
jgi:hydrophobe/amphiphile efflux-3 (HAE3) family protein